MTKTNHVQMRATTTVQRTVKDPLTGQAVKEMIAPGTIFFVDESEAAILERLGGAKRDSASPTSGTQPAPEPKAPASEDFRDEDADKAKDDEPPAPADEGADTAKDDEPPVQADDAPKTKATARKAKATKVADDDGATEALV